MKILFKWNGNWQTVVNHIPKHLRAKYFGRPVTSEHNLGLWQNGHFVNCNVGNYIIKNSKGNYEVLNHEKANDKRKYRN